MSITSGFYNSLNGDRKYNSEQFGELFNGIIKDGIFMSIGERFSVKAKSGFDVLVGTGRAWLHGTWIRNDAAITVSLSSPAAVQSRIDAVILEVDRTQAVRAASVKVVEGALTSSAPVPPTLVNTEDITQVPLAHIMRKAGSKSISQSDITNKIGTGDCPYVTGVLETMNIDNLIAQWEAEWDENLDDKNEEFVTWFDGIKEILQSDPAGDLAMAIDEHKRDNGNPHKVTLDQVDPEKNALRTVLDPKTYGNTLPETPGPAGTIFFLRNG